MIQSQIPTSYKYSMIEYSTLEEQMFKANFYIYKFGVEHVIPWIMAMRNKNKVTYLATNVLKPSSNTIIFKVNNNYY